MNLQQRLFTDIYRRAKGVEGLPWNSDVPALLRQVAERRKPGRALDLGCGAGVHAVYLAQQGYSVVGVDFVPAALELARERARIAGVELELHQADVLTYNTPAAFDLVLDSGCLHHIPPGEVSKYRAQLDQWLQPGGDYILVHFSKQHALDWRPVGPRRVPKKQIVELFAPLHLEGYDETFFDVSFPIGKSLAGIYRFRR